jgi:PhnB protein
MLAPQLYLNGSCCRAMELYKQAFNAKIKSIMYHPEKEKFVIHAEMQILGHLVTMGDYGGASRGSADSTMELVAKFDSEAALRYAYEKLIDGGTTISPIGPIFFSACFVQFVDKFGVRWCFLV